MDPAAAERILPGNGRRIVRALEVIELTGRPFAAALPEPSYVRPAVQIGLRMPSAKSSTRRIDARVEAMWAAGLVEEVRALAAAGCARAGPRRKALGYAQVLDFLDGRDRRGRGAWPTTEQATRKFARRQLTWFGRDPRVQLAGRRPRADLLDAALAVGRG